MTIKLPEPEVTLAWCSWTEKWEARDLKHCLTRKEDDRIIAYTEAQLKQAIHDALDEAAKVCQSECNNWDNEKPLRFCADGIRKLKEQLK